ncbi:hypothetical protein BN2476_680088 [Paraburkholderia piptadeniae]|uniref:Uncharacterized protein n=1 Tax=Paraburkholderia piptadeniae TaxID=1701573 RepID=A0A1N7SQY2_9BURK|nr:hypothetical protein BN2476_680088 [Paraburkholderia piptadeniae]
MAVHTAPPEAAGRALPHPPKQGGCTLSTPARVLEKTAIISGRVLSQDMHTGFPPA